MDVPRPYVFPVLRIITSLTLVLLLSPVTQAATNFSINDVLAALKDKQVSNVDEALAQIPSEYREHFMVSFDSLSRQSGTTDAPRILFASPDAKAVFTVTGTGRNSDQIEFMQFKDGSYEFTIGVIENNRVKQIPPTPGQCTGCHHADARPNWQSYPSWPGFLGSGRRSKSEPTILDHLKNDLASQPIYRNLPRIEILKLYDFENRNKAFTSAMGGNNAVRIARLIRSSSQYAKWKYAILAATVCPVDFKSFVPENLRTEVGAKKSLLAQTEIKDSAFEWIMKHLSIDFADWSMDYRRDQDKLYFPGIFTTAGRSEWMFAYALGAGDPDLGKFGKITNGLYSEMWRDLSEDDCAKLQKLSLESFSK